jgi:hypothetical protein
MPNVRVAPTAAGNSSVQELAVDLAIISRLLGQKIETPGFAFRYLTEMHKKDVRAQDGLQVLLNIETFEMRPRQLLHICALLDANSNDGAPKLKKKGVQSALTAGADKKEEE